MKLINAWAEKGYIYQTQNEIYILDALPKEKAKYCIRMNLGGIAFSQNGWQGPYNSAWTIDGKFNADFITAGTLRGIRITNGNNFNVDADGNVTANGLKATNAEIAGKIKGGTIEGETTINVGTDLRVGRQVFLSASSETQTNIFMSNSFQDYIGCIIRNGKGLVRVHGQGSASLETSNAGVTIAGNDISLTASNGGTISLNAQEVKVSSGWSGYFYDGSGTKINVKGGLITGIG